MSLAENMERWRVLKAVLDAVEDRITTEVLKLKQTQVVNGARATYSGGTKKYDYEGIATHMKASKDVIAKYTESKVNWRKVVSEIEAPEEVTSQFFTQTDPYVKLKLED